MQQFSLGDLVYIRWYLRNFITFDGDIEGDILKMQPPMHVVAFEASHASNNKAYKQGEPHYKLSDGNWYRREHLVTPVKAAKMIDEFCAKMAARGEIVKRILKERVNGIS